MAKTLVESQQQNINSVVTEEEDFLIRVAFFTTCCLVVVLFFLLENIRFRFYHPKSILDEDKKAYFPSLPPSVSNIQIPGTFHQQRPKPKFIYTKNIEPPKTRMSLYVGPIESAISAKSALFSPITAMATRSTIGRRFSQLSEEVNPLTQLHPVVAFPFALSERIFDIATDISASTVRAIIYPYVAIYQFFTKNK